MEPLKIILLPKKSLCVLLTECVYFDLVFFDLVFVSSFRACFARSRLRLLILLVLPLGSPQRPYPLFTTAIYNTIPITYRTSVFGEKTGQKPLMLHSVLCHIPSSNL